jgi:predicted signal transduction protein with EAL and GGDEF domain
VARRLKANLRIYDGVGRLGGEEFLLILPGCDLTAAMMRANQLRLFVAETAATSDATREITLSMGVAIAEPGSDFKIEALLAKADVSSGRTLTAGRSEGARFVAGFPPCLTEAGAEPLDRAELLTLTRAAFTGHRCKDFPKPEQDPHSRQVRQGPC